MGRDRRLEVDEDMVWSQKSATALAHPISGALPSSTVKYARPTELMIHDRSANAEVAVGYQLADEDDENDWGTAVLLSPGYSTSSTPVVVSTFTDLSAAMTKRKVRFVILVRNTTGTAVEVARVGVKIDVREP